MPENNLAILNNFLVRKIFFRLLKSLLVDKKGGFGDT